MGKLTPAPATTQQSHATNVPYLICRHLSWSGSAPLSEIAVAYLIWGWEV